MAEDRGGFRLVRVGPHSPLLISFDFDEFLVDRAAVRSGLAVGRITLHDRAREGFYGGVAGLGDTIDGTVSALKAIIEGLAPSRIMTIGRGAGGHAALVYGVLLGAVQIISIEPYAHLIEEFLVQYHDLRWRRELSRLPDPALAGQFEVTSLIDREGYNGHAHILLGTRRIYADGDATHLSSVHAHWLDRSSRVTLHPFAEITPGQMTDPTYHDLVSRRISELLFDDTPTPPKNSEFHIPSSLLTSNSRAFMYDAKLTICKIDERDPANHSGGPVAYASAGEVDARATRKFDDGLRQWVAENLLLDASPDDLADALLSRGISRDETLKEVELARSDTYYLASRRLSNRLVKRDWLITTYRKLNRLRRKSPKIERRDSLSIDRFLKEYYSTGRPLILTGMMRGWPALECRILDELARRPFAGDPVEPQLDRGPAGSARGLPPHAIRLCELLPELGDARTPRSPTSAVDRELKGGEKAYDLPEFHELFENEREFVDRNDGMVWIGLEGSNPPQYDEGANTLMLQVSGEVLMKVVPWWDTILMEEARRSSARPEDVPTAASHLSPLDRPEVLEFTLNPSELLFLPAGCQSQFEYVQPMAMISFDRLIAPHSEGNR